jgi:5-methylthioadenosine/S-adenosylhomocysteine deaminase
MELFFDSQGPMMELFNYLGWKESPPAQRKTPIQYLADIGFLEAPVSIIGGLHLSEQDFPLLARNLTKVIYCPISNKTLKHGIFPLGKLVESGIPIGLGTDIWNTRLGFNLWDEMRYALQKGSNPLPTAAELLRIATLGGARVLGLDHVIGTLEKNKQSDYIAVHTHNFDGSELALKRLVIETEPQHVTTVVVGENNLKTTR